MFMDINIGTTPSFMAGAWVIPINMIKACNDGGKPEGTETANWEWKIATALSTAREPSD